MGRIIKNNISYSGGSSGANDAKDIATNDGSNVQDKLDGIDNTLNNLSASDISAGDLAENV